MAGDYMQERIRNLFNEAIKIRNEIFLQKAINGFMTEEEKLIYEFLDKLGDDYIKLTDELYVLKPFKIYICGGELNGRA
jgi:hypothetical protein